MNRNKRKALEQRVQEYVQSLPPASLSDEEQDRMVSELLHAEDESHAHQNPPSYAASEVEPPHGQGKTPAWLYAAAAVVIIATAVSFYQRWTATDADTFARQHQLLEAARDSVQQATNDGVRDMPGDSGINTVSARPTLTFVPVQAVFTFRNTEAARISDSAQLRAAITTVESVLRNEGIRCTLEDYAISTAIEVTDLTHDANPITPLRFTAGFSTGTIDIHPVRFTLLSVNPDETQLRRIIENIRAEVYNAARR